MTATITLQRSKTEGAYDRFQAVLDKCDVLIGHNIKFDLQWIRACGFEYEGDIYDTMVAEYILSRGQGWPLNLSAVARKYGGVQKRETDLVPPYLDAGHTFYEIPWEIVKEYGEIDVIATEQVAVSQLEEFETTFEEMFVSKSLVPTLKLSLEMTNVLSRVERNGLRINLDTSSRSEKSTPARWRS